MTARRNIMLGTAGHVDHGKSAVVKLLTGCETDTLAEEKERGLTIDLGFAPCRLADQRVVGIVDVPGHVDFIRNMVAGAHGIDVVLFVVAADDGIMPQTLEHLHILTLMGLRHGLVVLTKTDLVDVARRDQVTRELRRLLAGTFLNGAPICPVSNITGEGFEGFFDALNNAVDACADRPCQGPFRLWVEDSFSIRGAGTVVTGIPTHGRIAPGATLHLQPAGLSGHVRRMQVYGEEAQEGRAGECVALNLPELEPGVARRGLTLVESAALEPVAMAEADLEILGSIQGTIEDYLEVQFHVGTASTAAHLAMLEKIGMTGGQKQAVQLRFAAPVPVVPGERFIVRANLPGGEMKGLTTIGGGQILGLNNTRLRRRKSWTLDRLSARRSAVDDATRWCEQIVRENTAPVTVGDLQKQCWSRAEEIAAALEQLKQDRRVLQVPRGWLHCDVVRHHATALLAAVEKFHAANPRRTGLQREELLACLPLPATVLDAAADWLVAAKQLEQRRALLAKAGWAAQLPDADAQLGDRLTALLKDGGLSPPGVEDLAARLNQPADRVASIARVLADRGTVVRIDEKIWMHRDAVETGKETALRLFRLAPVFSTMAFRDALGVSRKYAVPLVDYLDRLRFTVRSGNNRTPGVEAKKLLIPPHEN